MGLGVRVYGRCAENESVLSIKRQRPPEYLVVGMGTNTVIFKNACECI